MKFRGIALAVVGVVAATMLLMTVPTSGTNFLESSDSAFNRYIAKHGKSYATKEEYAFRKALFDKSMDEVTAHNSQNGPTWNKAINRFSDMTSQEIKRYLGAGHLGEIPTEVLPPYPTEGKLQ
jgi:hypothetical protein